MKLLKSLFLVSTFCFTYVLTGEMITSPPVTNWGDWNPIQRCPEGTFARGFQLKTQYSQGGLIDDTALNGVKLFCGNPTIPETVNITSAEGTHGQWGRVFTCEGGYIYGFQLRVVHEQDGGSDQTATGNVRVFCTNTDPEAFIEGDGWLLQGDWGEERKCARTQGLCGLQVQLEYDHGLLHDDTALNNIAAECCDIKGPTTTTSTTEAPTTRSPTTRAPTAL